MSNPIDALAEFAAEAVALLKDRNGEPSLVPSWYWDWERVGEEAFRAEESVSWKDEWDESWGDIEALDSYRTALAAIEDDERMRGQLGNLVGTSRNRTTLNTEQQFHGLVKNAVVTAGSYDLDASDFRDAAESFVLNLRAERIETRQLVQLLGIVGPAL